ncbi:hypothetical protein PR048_026623 [Dryococelus australis]|uniref:Uncharacterized protein n=1 Tax=Dryococelus australis TaxID=614101 RepID=A0ABQ9GLW8_9NEOP|nr:hypothetical protein PR048_026623 [Dryococelus australis]
MKFLSLLTVFESLDIISKSLKSETSRIRNAKRHFDEFCVKMRDFMNLESSTRITLFYLMVDTLCTQLENRFLGMKDFLNTYQVIQPIPWQRKRKCKLEKMMSVKELADLLIVDHSA